MSRDVMQDRADIVAKKVLRLLETGHTSLVVALNNALIQEGRFAPAVKLAGASSSNTTCGGGLSLLAVSLRWTQCMADMLAGDH